MRGALTQKHAAGRMEDWEQLAQRWGIFASFTDAQGQTRAATPDAIRRIAEALQNVGDLVVSDGTAPQVVPAYQGAVSYTHLTLPTILRV